MNGQRARRGRDTVRKHVFLPIGVSAILGQAGTRTIENARRAAIASAREQVGGIVASSNGKLAEDHQ